MTSSLKVLSLLAAVTLTGVAQAQLQVSIAVRETGFAGGAFSQIGGDGGSAGGIEWINKDGQVLVLDGTWQKFTFNLTTDPVAGFAGTSANGILEGAYGTLEHIRIVNAGGRTEAMSLFVDDVSNTTTMGGTTTFGTFEGFAQGTEVMFQEPTFSGSTSANIVAGGTSGVDNLVASRSASCRVNFQFVDGTATRWLRLTTFNATNQRNPLIRFDDGAVVEFWMRGGECGANLGSQGPGGAYAELCGSGMNSGETSIYSVAGAQANAAGAFALSVGGMPDLPLLGGNLVSGTGLIVGISIFANAQGRVSFPLPGQSSVVNLALQSVFLDGTTPIGLGFTNAVEAKLGQ
jgi:hypothetical protein